MPQATRDEIAAADLHEAGLLARREPMPHAQMIAGMRASANQLKANGDVAGYMNLQSDIALLETREGPMRESKRLPPIADGL